MQGDRVNRKSKKAELDRSTGKGVGAMRKDELVVKFSDRDSFGDLCKALFDDHERFTLAGFQTVIVKRAHVGELPAQSRRVLEKYLDTKVAELLATVSKGQRHLPTPEEASRLFREFAKNHT